MSALDDTGTIAAPVCPLCEAWAVTVSLDDVSWPLAGLLVEQAIDEHVDEHVRIGSATTSTADPRPERARSPRRVLADTNRNGPAGVDAGGLVSVTCEQGGR